MKRLKNDKPQSSPHSRRDFLLGAGAGLAAGAAATAFFSTTGKKEPMQEGYSEIIAAQGAIMALAKSAVALHVNEHIETHADAIAATHGNYENHLKLIGKMLSEVEFGSEFRDNLIRTLRQLKKACPDNDRALFAATHTMPIYGEALPDNDPHLSNIKENRHLVPLVEEAIDAVIARLRQIKIVKTTPIHR